MGPDGAHGGTKGWVSKDDLFGDEVWCKWQRESQFSQFGELSYLELLAKTALLRIFMILHVFLLFSFALFQVLLQKAI